MNYAVFQFSGMVIVILLLECVSIDRRASNLLLLDRDFIVQLSCQIHFQLTNALSPRWSINYTREKPALHPLSESYSPTQVPWTT